MVNFLLAAALALPLAAVAHPGDNVEAIKREMAQRNEQHAYASRALSECQNTPKALAMKKRTAERRAAKAIELREKRGLSHSKTFCASKSGHDENMSKQSADECNP